MQEEETGAEVIDGRTVLAVGGVWDGDVVEDGEAGASGFELGADDFEEVRHLQTLKIKGAGRGRRGDGGVGGGGLSGGDAGGERRAGEALLEGTALLLSTLLGGKTLDGLMSWRRGSTRQRETEAARAKATLTEAEHTTRTRSQTRRN